MVNNSIAKRTADITDKAVEFKAGEEIVKLSPSIIKRYLVNGSGMVTDQEVVMFLNLCRFQHLNPFLREAYLIKYGNNPATMVVGKDAITKRAMRNASFSGQQAGVVVQQVETGELEYRPGALVLEDEKLVGGWAKVFVKGYQEPIEAVVGLSEYVGTKKTGEVNEQWTKRPATMIRKVALMQALREAFPDDLAGMYDSSEMGVDLNESAMAPVDMDNLPPAVQAEPVQPEAPLETLEGF